MQYLLIVLISLEIMVLLYSYYVLFLKIFQNQCIYLFLKFQIIGIKVGRRVVVLDWFIFDCELLKIFFVDFSFGNDMFLFFVDYRKF